MNQMLRSQVRILAWDYDIDRLELEITCRYLEIRASGPNTGRNPGGRQKKTFYPPYAVHLIMKYLVHNYPVISHFFFIFFLQNNFLLVKLTSFM